MKVIVNEQLLDEKEEMDRFLEEKRPAQEIRNKVDLAYRIEEKSIVIFEIRPMFMNPLEKTEIPIAKATFVKKSNQWKVYWMRSDLKWHAYGPEPVVNSVRSFTRIVSEDGYGCFWG